MPDIRASRESSVLLWVLSSYLVLRRVDSELIASKVTTSGLVGWKPSIALTAVKLGTMNAKAATRIVASNAQRTAISFLLDCAAVPGRRLHQSPDMRQERESAKLAREQLVPAVGQRARRKPMGQPARLVSMVVLKALAQQVPVSTQSVRLTMRPALVQTQPVRCLQTLHMPGKIVPAYQLYFRSGRSTPSCASLPQIGLIAIASMLLFSITPQPAPTRNDTKRGSLNAVVLTRCQLEARLCRERN